jgi:aldehyde dehydrogenase (NAD+)
VAQAAAAQLLPCHLELGGRDMAYVHHDVPDVGRAARQLADSAFANSGQTCCAVRHVLVHEALLPEFCSR